MYRCLFPSAGILSAVLCACAAGPIAPARNTTVFIPSVRNRALSWRAPGYTDTIFGLDVLHDGPPTSSVELAVTRAVLHTNPQLGAIDALRLSSEAVRAARANGISPEFFAATLLQESAFDPRALSWAGAVGIAQFMPETAAGMGVDPFDPFAAIDGAAELLASYVRAYRAVYDNPYTAALAAYNAGPGAVETYHGVPPYAETREYIADIVDRWARIAGYESSARKPRASGE